MNKKEYGFLSLILIVALFFGISGILAQGNDSGNNSNNTNSNCTIRDNKCCLGEVCNTAASCINGTYPHFKGCDNNCITQIECISGNTTSSNCTIKDGKCCKGEVCSIVQGQCVNGTYPHFKGCDNNCTMKVECRNYSSNETKEQKRERIREAIQERNRIHFENKTGQECPSNCTCTGVVVKCRLENGTREMTVYARSGNIIIITKGVNASTNVTLYHHSNKTYGNFSNETKEIKYLPDQAKEKIEVRIHKRLGDIVLELNEDGYYVVQTQKRARLFFLFPVREKIRAQVEVENGEVKIRNPWWGFLASDINEDDEQLVGESCGTVTPGYNDKCCVNKGYDFWNATKQECDYSD